ncbi:MAG: arginyl-tRNA synthetase [Candidatus Peribacteria bacterium]|nr:arginyl-tRNA synthetase [Candidatus Peribacteria bacterium]
MFASLSQQAKRLLQAEFPDLEVDVAWERPSARDHGDCTTTVALQLAKKVGRSPKEIAQFLVDGLQNMPDVENVELAGPGYVNVRLTLPALLKELEAAMNEAKPKESKKDEGPVIIEYSQPNIAKPLGAHHIIGTAIGQALVNIYRHAGHTVIAWNYLGDYGTQFGKLSVAFSKWGTKPVEQCSVDDLLDLYVKFHEEAEQDKALEDLGRAASLRLEEGDEELRAFWKKVVAITKESLGELYRRLHVSFDLDLGESFYEDKMVPVIEEGKAKGVFVEGEKGSLIVQFPNDLYPPYLILRGDGATLYSTRDLAQMKYRMETYHPQAIFIATDIAQKLHFEQLIETCRMLGWELPEFENILFGRMRFVEKSMSTRKGNILKLEHVLDEAVERAQKVIAERGDAIQTDEPAALAEMMGVGALVYGILSQNRKMDLVFDWEKMLSFDGNSAPYLQYTHARARSVLRKAEQEVSVQGVTGVTAMAPHDRLLVNTLLQYPTALQEALDTRMPHKLANYLYQLAQDFNAFYNAESILQAEESLRKLRLALTLLTADTLRAGTALLAIQVPDRM